MWSGEREWDKERVREIEWVENFVVWILDFNVMIVEFCKNLIWCGDVYVEDGRKFILFFIVDFIFWFLDLVFIW